jgi:arylformamidase
MNGDKLAIRQVVDRRCVLAGAVASLSTPAWAESCRVGPPQHERGPNVWLDMDQVEIDAAYDQDQYAPLAGQIRHRFAVNSDQARKRLGEPIRLSYGDSKNEYIDLYRTSRPRAPLFVFLHGGAWLGGRARDNAFAAELFVDAGAHFAVVDFIQIAEAQGDLSIMADQVQRAIGFVYRHADDFGGDRSRLFVGGFSSGAHLAGVALTTDWRQKKLGLPRDLIKGGLCMSGLYDMKPVRISKRSSYINFSDELEAAMSSIRHLDALTAPVIVTTGTNETPEFQRQNTAFAEALDRHGKLSELVIANGYNHFEMGESLSNPYGPNGRSALKLLNL